MGEITDYTKMMVEPREQALDRMIEEVKKLGANAIIRTRFITASLIQEAAEFLAYGTAMVVKSNSYLFLTLLSPQKVSSSITIPL